MRIFVPIAGLIICVLASAAATAETSLGRALAEQAFADIDGAGSGTVTIEAVLDNGSDVRSAIDADGDGAMSVSEFAGWGFGMQSLAEDVDRKAALDAALRVVHAVWDVNGDGEISLAEHTYGISASFLSADTNEDGVLSSEEFLEGFLVMKAMRAAIRDSDDSANH